VRSAVGSQMTNVASLAAVMLARSDDYDYSFVSNKHRGFFGCLNAHRFQGLDAAVGVHPVDASDPARRPFLVVRIWHCLILRPLRASEPGGAGRSRDAERHGAHPVGVVGQRGLRRLRQASRICSAVSVTQAEASCSSTVRPPGIIGCSSGRG
jgi:hypothetical protein